MHFRSIADLNAAVLANLRLLPRDIDVVIGIPRSGLLPAAMIALTFNLPLASVDGFADGRLLSSGRTKWRDALATEAARCRKALLVDDSVQSGAAMSAAVDMLKAARPDLEVITLAVYGVHGFSLGADIVLERVGQPRVFEWNVMHHKVLATACVDIDGILCDDPDDAQNDDGARYVRFLAETPPLHRPTREIMALVTSRLEKYRAHTEAWLERHDVKYGRLALLDLADAKTRRASAAHAPFKAEVYASIADAELFIESNRGQAEEIAVLARKPVLWLPGGTMFYHDGVAPRDSRAFARAAGRYGRSAKRLIRGLVGAAAYERLKHVLRPHLVAPVQ